MENVLILAISDNLSMLAAAAGGVISFFHTQSLHQKIVEPFIRVALAADSTIIRDIAWRSMFGVRDFSEDFCAVLVLMSDGKLYHAIPPGFTPFEKVMDDVDAEAAPKPKQLRGYVQYESPSSSSTPAVDLSAASLTIKDEGKTEEEKPLDEPDDSNIQAISDTPYTSASTFEALNLSPELLRGVYSEKKFQRPNKIQATSLPMILTPPHKNLISETDNGSGNTNCFVLGMLSRIDPKMQVPQALCICPTRELAIQNLEVLRKMGKHTGIETECAIPVDRSDSKFSQRPPVKAQVVIGTPGTIKKWMAYRKLGVSNMKILVFDEADHMLSEDGFEDDSLRIMKNIERSGANVRCFCFLLLSMRW